jgi:hypothetical protein
LTGGLSGRLHRGWSAKVDLTSNIVEGGKHFHFHTCLTNSITVAATEVEVEFVDLVYIVSWAERGMTVVESVSGVIRNVISNDRETSLAGWSSQQAQRKSFALWVASRDL